MDLRPEQDRHIDAASCRRFPGMSPPSLPGCLPVRNRQSSMRRPFISHLPDTQIGRICHIIIYNTFPCPLCIHQTFQFFFCDHIRARGDAVAFISHRFHLISLILQLTNHFPDRSAGYSKPFAQLLTGYITVRLTKRFQYFSFHYSCSMCRLIRKYSNISRF